MRSNILEIRDDSVLVIQGENSALDIADTPRPKAVTKNVETRQFASLISVIHIAANHADAGVQVVIIEDRIDCVRRRWIVRIGGVLDEALANAPPIVFASTGIGSALQIKLLALVFAHISDQHVVVYRVKAGPKRIAQAITEDFLFLGKRTEERIVTRDGVGAVVLDVDAQDFSE